MGNAPLRSEDVTPIKPIATRLSSLWKWVGEDPKADMRLLEDYCARQIVSLLARMHSRFDMFLSRNPNLLYELELLSIQLPPSVSLEHISMVHGVSRRRLSNRHTSAYSTPTHGDVGGGDDGDGRFLGGGGDGGGGGGAVCDDDVGIDAESFDDATLRALQSFGAIANWLHHALGGGNRKRLRMPSNVHGLRKFLEQLDVVDHTDFVNALCVTKYWFLYDLPQLVRLATNLLYHENDLCYVTLICAAEGFLDIWAVLKANQLFTQKLEDVGLSEEWAQAFQTFSILSTVTRMYPGQSLSSFNFIFELTLERMEFLHVNPTQFEFVKVLGTGADGIVRKMRYKDKYYAVKSISPLLDPEEERLPPPEETNTLKFSGLRYMAHIHEMVESHSSTYWQWLYSRLGEYLSMLVLPRQGFVKCYHCYVGEFPSPPKYYCPICFETKFDVPEHSTICERCGSSLNATFYGKKSLHIVMEYCPMGSLRTYLDEKLGGVPCSPSPSRDGPNVHMGTSLPEAQVYDFLSRILSALAYNHARKIVHKDLKPDNVLLRTEEDCCLGDFGTASFAMDRSDTVVGGSPAYNPPEINSGLPIPEGYNAAMKDIWAAGVIAMEMLGYRVPIADMKSALESVKKKHSAALHELISLLLEPDHARRPTALDCLIALERARNASNGRHAATLVGRQENASAELHAQTREVALVIEKFQLLSYSDHSIPLEAKVTRSIFRDYETALGSCCQLYLSLLDDEDQRVQMMCCSHLARILSNVHFRPIILANEQYGGADLISRLAYFLDDARTSLAMKLRIVDIFYVLTEPSGMEDARRILPAFVTHLVLPRMLVLSGTTKMAVLKRCVAIVMERCIRLGSLPAAHYANTIAPLLWTTIRGSPSLEDRARALHIVALGALAYPEEVHLFAQGGNLHYIMDLRYASCAALEGMSHMSQSVRGGSALSMLLRMSPSSSSPSACGQSSDVLLQRAYAELMAKSKLFTKVEDTLNAIVEDCDEILSFFVQHCFPMAKCCACGQAMHREMHRCAICAELYFCSACAEAHRPPLQPYTRHEKTHELSLVTKPPHYSLRDAISKYKPLLQVRTSFLRPSVATATCPKCNKRLMIKIPSCNQTMCLSCGHKCCFRCGAAWTTSCIRSSSPATLFSNSAETSSRRTAPSIPPRKDHPINPKGHPINPKDHPINPKGHPINPKGHSIPHKDHPINPKGHSINPKGHPIPPHKDHPINPKDHPINPKDHSIPPHKCHPVYPTVYPTAPCGVSDGIDGVCVGDGGAASANNEAYGRLLHGIFHWAARQQQQQQQREEHGDGDGTCDGDAERSDSSGGVDTKDGCTHPLISYDEIFEEGTLCSVCTSPLSPEDNTIIGPCGHGICHRCSPFYATKLISMGELTMRHTDGSYGLMCPREFCDSIIIDSDAIHRLVEPQFFTLYHDVVEVLKQGNALKYGRCSYCSRILVVGGDYMMWCYACTFKDSLQMPERAPI